MKEPSLGYLSIRNRTDQEHVFGLVAVQGHIHNSEQKLKSIMVSVADETRMLDSMDVIFLSSETVQAFEFNIMSHLLPNGLATVDVVAKFADGSETKFESKRVRIANTSELAAKVSNDLRANGNVAILPRIVDSAMFPYADGQAKAWFDQTNPLSVPMSFAPAASLEDAHHHLQSWGYCILPETLPTNLIDQFKAELQGAIDSGQLPHEPGSSQRIHNAHKLPSGRSIWLYPQVIAFLNTHFRDAPCACQTLTYVNGSEQNAHQDTIHLTPYPAGFMCGVWIALEDIQPGTGELFVYPGSHKMPRLRACELGLEKVDEDYSSYAVFDSKVRSLLDEHGFERHIYQPKAGEILVWHENLVHGGSPRQLREKTRLSIVSHYFAQGAVAYYDARGEAAALEILPEV